MQFSLLCSSILYSYVVLALPPLMLHQIVVAAKAASQARQSPAAAAWAATHSTAARSEAVAAAGHSGNDNRGLGEPGSQSAGKTTQPVPTAAGRPDEAVAAGPSGSSRESAEPARQPAGMQARAAGRTADAAGGNAEPASQLTGRSPHPSIPQRTWKRFAKAEKSRVAEYKGVRWGLVCNLPVNGGGGTWGSGQQSCVVHCLLLLCHATWHLGITRSQHRAEQPSKSELSAFRLSAGAACHLAMPAGSAVSCCWRTARGGACQVVPANMQMPFSATGASPLHAQRLPGGCCLDSIRWCAVVPLVDSQCLCPEGVSLPAEGWLT